MYLCKICNKEFKKIYSLAHHINKYHINITLQEYYDKHFLSNTSGKFCKICNNSAIFQNLTKGYKQTCSNIKCIKENRLNNMKKTCMKRFGVKNSYQAKEIKDKIKKTKKELHGDENYNNSLMISKTWKNRSTEEKNETNKKKQLACFKKKGVLHHTQTQEYQNLIRNKDFIKRQQARQYKTKKKNNTFGSSKQEQLFKQILEQNNIKFKYQYKSEVYPFMCDFYIPSKDLYIELNLNWTHGRCAFDKNNKEHLEIIEQWRKKSEELNFKGQKKTYYNVAINVWTRSDVRKRETAKKNNLNYLEIFNFDELQDIVDDWKAEYIFNKKQLRSFK